MVVALQAQKPFAFTCINSCRLCYFVDFFSPPSICLSRLLSNNTVAAPTKPWRDCAKDYGVKTASLTSAFASVAMLLRFDSYTGFEDHLQMEYAAENLW